MQKARGKWAVFVDPDDHVEPFYLQTLLGSVEGTKSVVGIGGFLQIDTRTGEVQNFRMAQNEKDALLAEKYLSFYGYQASVLWNKIYSIDFLHKNKLFFDETVTFAEDCRFNLQVYKLISFVGLCSDCGYRYMVTGNSATNRFHPYLAEYLLENSEIDKCLRLKYGSAEQILIDNDIEKSAEKVFFLVVNYFKKGCQLTIKEKMNGIHTDVVQNDYLMDCLKKNSSANSLKVRICKSLVLRHQFLVLVVLLTVVFRLRGIVRWMCRKG